MSRGLAGSFREVRSQLLATLAAQLQALADKAALYERK
jgi:hypothetical protein